MPPRMTAPQERILETLSANLFEKARHLESLAVVAMKSGPNRESAQAVTRAALLMALANSILNPGVFKAGPNIDPFEQRLKEIRQQPEVLAGLPAMIVADETGQAVEPELKKRLDAFGKKVAAEFTILIEEEISIAENPIDDQNRGIVVQALRERIDADGAFGSLEAMTSLGTPSDAQLLALYDGSMPQSSGEWAMSGPEEGDQVDISVWLVDSEGSEFVEIEETGDIETDKEIGRRLAAAMNRLDFILANGLELPADTASVAPRI